MRVTQTEIDSIKQSLFKSHGVELVKIATMMRAVNVTAFDTASTYELLEVFAGCVGAKLREMGKTTSQLRDAVMALDLAHQSIAAITSIPEDADVLAAMLTRRESIDAITSAKSR